MGTRANTVSYNIVEISNFHGRKYHLLGSTRYILESKK